MTFRLGRFPKKLESELPGYWDRWGDISVKYANKELVFLVERYRMFGRRPISETLSCSIVHIL